MMSSSDRCWNTYDDNQFQTRKAEWLMAADKFAGQDSLPSDEKMVQDLERGIWAKWIPGLHTTEQVCEWTCAKTGIVTTREEFESIYSPVEDRFKELGILKEANVEIHWYQSAEKEDRKLMAWASQFHLLPWAPSPSN